MIKTAIIPDAGLGSRFFPMTKTLPKGMLPLLNRPVMEWLVLECIEAGIEQIIIVTNDNGMAQYNAYFKNDLSPSIKNYADKIIILTQDKRLPYGSASPILTAQPYLENLEAFVVLLGDDVVVGQQNDTLALINSFTAEPTLGAVLAAQQMGENELQNYGVVKFKDKQMMLLEEIVERPQSRQSPSTFVSYGRYLLTYKIFDYLNPKNMNTRGEFSIVDGITQMAQHISVKVIYTEGIWVTTGDPVNYLKAHIRFALTNLENRDLLKNFLEEIHSRVSNEIKPTV